MQKNEDRKDIKRNIQVTVTFTYKYFLLLIHF